MKVLVADDDQQIVNFLERILPDIVPDCSLVTASDAKEALDKLNEDDFSLVIFDIEMPGFILPGPAGIRLVKKARKKNPQIKVILMSGNVQRHQSEIEDLRINGLLFKPFKKNQVKARVGQVLGL